MREGEDHQERKEGDWRDVRIVGRVTRRRRSQRMRLGRSDQGRPQEENSEAGIRLGEGNQGKPQEGSGGESLVGRRYLTWRNHAGRRN